MYALIAEPDASCAAEYAAAVEQLGLRAVVVEDGEQALVSLARWGLPKLAFVELSMPLLDGFGLFERLRALSPRPRVVAVSPFRTLRGFVAYSASRFGVDLVLPRAVDRSTLLRVTRALLELTPISGEMFREPSRTRVRPVRPHEPGIAPSDSRLNWFVDRIMRELSVDGAMARVELDDGRMLVATSGFDLREARRIEPFYRLVVEASAPLVVPDTRVNPYFQEEPSVRAGQVRGYAGCPLMDASLRTRGSLSVLSSRGPLQLDLTALSELSARAGQISDVVSYLGGKAMPREDQADVKQSSVRLSAAAQAAMWGEEGFDEAPTEPGTTARARS